MRTAAPTQLTMILSGDADFDGVTDNVDECPNARETYNQFQDEDGCPDTISDNKGTPDTDSDGIVDNIDFCPNQPETSTDSKMRTAAQTALTLHLILTKME